MHVLIIGATGLLGSQAAQELLARGHTVRGLALPALPTGYVTPTGVTLTFGNYVTMSDDDLRQACQGIDGLIFAAGVDERVEGPKPIYDLYDKFNIRSLERILTIAQQSGVKHAVICGSYFSYFAKRYPQWHLAENHPYIRSRLDQEKIAFSFAKDGQMDISVLELPYIFGTQPGRKPVWVFLVEMIQAMPKRTYWPRGGTAMVTVRQVGQAIAGALEMNKGANAYPIGWDNLMWKQMLALFHKHMGVPDKPITTIPTWMFRLGMKKQEQAQEERGVDGGLKMKKFARTMASELFIPKDTCQALGVTDDDIDAAIGQSVALCLDIIRGKTVALGMKGE